MARPPKENRSEVHSTVYTVKLSPNYRALAQRITDSRAAELHKINGQHFSVTLSDVLRWLLEKEGAARGLLASSSAKAPDVPDAAALRRRLEAAIRGGMSGRAIAKAGNIDAGALSRFRKDGTGLGEPKLRALRDVLPAEGKKTGKASGKTAA